MSHTDPSSHSQTPTGQSGGRSHLAAGTKLSGDLTVPGLMELLGHADGTIVADGIVIEEGGSVVGELRAGSIAIKGSFEGRIVGGEVRLQSRARVSGEIIYAKLVIESGADVNAACSRASQAST
ncbi:polymer-forming cytoskeletal protein [Seohaeicola saemankumensis]|nr:polymer-forming cytoskeletal protein [Seohaeicola saemankumensis]MCA0872219.1 polymer-forming cytoskeletal protein [Seohaeicola saemankumensis]